METMEILQKAIQKELGRDVGVLTPETTFEEMALDSLDAVQVVMAIEEAFDIEIADDDMDGIANLGQLVDYIEAKTR